MTRTPSARPRVLLVDLNNHARYPTIAVGLLTAVLRTTGHPTRLLSPLAVGVDGPARDQRARPWSLLDERLRWWSARTGVPAVKSIRRWLGRRRRPDSGTDLERIAAAFQSALAAELPEVVLLSAYSMYERAVHAIAELCARKGIPVLVGGPGFTDLHVAREWVQFPGVVAVFAGEVEPNLTTIVARAAAGQSLSSVPGCVTAGDEPVVAPPMAELDALPFPDYDDFPWERYPVPVVSILTGRGCGWGHCSFCSDVFTSNGRTFRSRSAENVLAEIRQHHERYGVTLFHFSDLKLNSNVEVWRALAHKFQAAAPGALWTASVHAGGKGDQGLSLEDLRAAREAGLVRITTGLESGSSRLLSRMAKGVSAATLERFIEDAARAGISTRLTAFTGYPSETADDLRITAELLERHRDAIDRVHMSRFLILPGTPIAEEILTNDADFPELDVTFGRSRTAPIDHVDRRIDTREYQRALARLLSAVHAINRKPLPEFARPLEGAM